VSLVVYVEIADVAHINKAEGEEWNEVGGQDLK